jgi:hypothetical protein
MSTHPAVETKIELVTEAIEALVLAQTVALRPGHDRYSGTRAHEDLVAARGGVHDALKELLTPTLRVVCTEKIDEVGAITSTLRRTTSEVSNIA